MVQLNSLSGWGMLCGISLGVGLWSLVSLVPRLRRPRLEDRVAPYLVDVSAGARQLLGRRSIDPLPIIGAMVGPAFARLGSILGTILGGGATVELRLRQSGSRLTVETFRSRQLLWASYGVGIGVLISAGISGAWFESISSFGAVPLPGAVSLPGALSLRVAIVAIFGLAGIVVRDHLLRRAATARLKRISSELPTVLEFLTLSLSAGEGILDAVRRVSRVSHGELAGELAGVVGAVNTGLPLAESLAALADAVRLPALTRCVDQITGALERGTPLAEVLRAQAQDARDEAKRGLLELAGKKEVAMLLPLVFLILPVTVIFAIFPGLFVLQLGI